MDHEHGMRGEFLLCAPLSSTAKIQFSLIFDPCFWSTRLPSINVADPLFDVCVAAWMLNPDSACLDESNMSMQKKVRVPNSLVGIASRLQREDVLTSYEGPYLKITYT